MAIQTIQISCTGTPDDAAMKSQLSMIPGIIEMNIDSRTHCIEVLYDDTLTAEGHIEASLDGQDYRVQS